jgi:probable F420-dependent oxidoreductase
VRYGVHLGWHVGGGIAEPEFAVAALQAVEAMGFESVWVGEHAAIPVAPTTRFPGGSDFPYSRDVAIPSPLPWIAHAAAVTATVRLGTQVLVLPHYNPVLLAKEAATVDRLAGGRLLLGVGLGWWPEEAEAVGYPFGQRSARAEEAIAILRAVWTGESFRGVKVLPKPVQSGGVPILVGGTSRAAAQRAGRLGDGWFPYPSGPDALEPVLGAFRDAADRAGRDPRDIEITCPLFPGDGIERRIGAFAEFGVTRLVLPCARFADVGELCDHLSATMAALQIS